MAGAEWELDDAHALLEQELALSRRIAAAHPQDGYWHGKWSLSLKRLGDVAVGQGRFEEAMSYYEQEMALMARSGSERDDRYGISIVHDQLSRAALRAGWLEKARAHCEESLALRRVLVEGHPSWERVLAVTFDDLGDVARHQGRLAEARAVCEHAGLVLRTLMETDPGDVDEDDERSRYATDSFGRAVMMADLALVCERLARVADAEGRPEESRALLERRRALAALREDARQRGEDAGGCFPQALVLSLEAARPTPPAAASRSCRTSRISGGRTCAWRGEQRIWAIAPCRSLSARGRSRSEGARRPATAARSAAEVASRR